MSSLYLLLDYISMKEGCFTKFVSKQIYEAFQNT